MRTKLPVIVHRKWDPIGAASQKITLNLRQNKLLDYPMKTALAFPPAILPNPAMAADETSSGGKYPPFPFFLPLCRYKVGIKFAIVCLEAKKTPTVKAFSLEFSDLLQPSFLAPRLLGVVC